MCTFSGETPCSLLAWMSVTRETGPSRAPTLLGEITMGPAPRLDVEVWCIASRLVVGVGIENLTDWYRSISELQDKRYCY